jgi:hypothetical protein
VFNWVFLECAWQCLIVGDALVKRRQQNVKAGKDQARSVILSAKIASLVRIGTGGLL